MNVVTLGTALRDAMLSMPVGNGQTIASLTTPAQQSEMLTAWTNVATAIIAHIQAYAIAGGDHIHTGGTASGFTGVPTIPPTIV